jgi:acyl phosphate:glycerol-3-phosphate acyltransferase
MIELAINITISYLIGSLSGSLILGKLRGIDIRKMGSGNAGGTNAFRTQGFIFAIGVVLIDVLKGFISAKYISTLNYEGFNININSEFNELSVLLCGLSAVVGHVYPIYHGFKGGKGAGAGIGMILALNSVSLAIAISLWIICLILTGFVGLGTMIAASSIPISLYIIKTHQLEYFPIFSIFLALFIVFTHRSNIVRMMNNEENQFKKAMLLKRLFN